MWRTYITKIDSGTPSIPMPTHQPPGKCDPESDVPCSCPRRRFVDPPDQIPMPATHSNVPALEGWIKEYYKESAFKQYCCKKPTVVPLNFRAQMKADIEADVMKGILERVPVGKPDSWCSMMVIQES